MRLLASRLVLASLVLALAACGASVGSSPDTSPPAPSQSAPPATSSPAKDTPGNAPRASGGPCDRSFTEWCPAGCSLREYAHEVAEYASDRCLHLQGVSAVVTGTCGGLLFVRVESTSDAPISYPMRTVTYYDARYQAVGIELGADVLGEGCVASTRYGRVPACEHRDEHVICSNPAVTRGVPFEWRAEQKAGPITWTYEGSRDLFAGRPTLSKVLASFAGCPSGNQPVGPEPILPQVATFACGDRQVVHVRVRQGEESFRETFTFFNASGAPVGEVTGVSVHIRPGVEEPREKKGQSSLPMAPPLPWEHLSPASRIGRTDGCTPGPMRLRCQGSPLPPSSRP